MLQLHIHAAVQLWNWYVQKPHDFLLGFNNRLCNKLYKRFVISMGFFKKFNVFMSKHWRNYSQKISILYQCGVHNEPRNSAISVFKRMNEDKSFMELCCKHYRMKLLSFGCNPLKKSIHFFLYAICFCHRISGAADENIHVTVSSGIFFLIFS